MLLMFVCIEKDVPGIVGNTLCLDFFILMHAFGVLPKS